MRDGLAELKSQSEYKSWDRQLDDAIVGGDIDDTTSELMS